MAMDKSEMSSYRGSSGWDFLLKTDAGRSMGDHACVQDTRSLFAISLLSAVHSLRKAAMASIACSVLVPRVWRMRHSWSKPAFTGGGAARGDDELLGELAVEHVEQGAEELEVRPELADDRDRRRRLCGWSVGCWCGVGGAQVGDAVAQFRAGLAAGDALEVVQELAVG